jgi:hypothetical protein
VQALGQVEYGSTSSISTRNGARKQRIMLGLCVASMLLAIAALTTNQEQSGAMTLEEKMQALKTGAQASEAAKEVVATQPKDAQPHALAESSPALPAAAAHETTVVPKAAEAATAVAPQQSAKSEPKEAVAKAQAQTQQQASVKSAEPAKAAAPKTEEVGKPAQAAVTAEPVQKQLIKAAEKPAESKPAAHAVVVDQAEAAKKRQLALAHLARVSKHTAVHDHMLATNSTSTDDASGNDSQSADGGDGLNSPLGNLEPTGIMSVFFNEKVRTLLVCCMTALSVQAQGISDNVENG